MFHGPWSSRWSWSLHPFLGRPAFLRPFGLCCSACFGSLFVSILNMCCRHFSWYCFISFAIFWAPIFLLIHWFFSLSSFVIPSKCLKFSSVLPKRCSSLFFSTQASLQNFNSIILYSHLLNVPYCVLYLYYIVLVKLYSWHYSGDQGLQIFPDRPYAAWTACWSALLHRMQLVGPIPLTDIISCLFETLDSSEMWTLHLIIYSKGHCKQVVTVLSWHQCDQCDCVLSWHQCDPLLKVSMGPAVLAMESALTQVIMVMKGVWVEWRTLSVCYLMTLTQL